MHILNIIKKYIPGIFIIIFLLVIQAQGDLKLPEYTSNIINVGIQQQGIESSLPNALSKDSYDAIGAIVNDEDFYKSYSLKTKNDADYVGTYELLKTEDIYVLNDLKKNQKSKLEDKLKKAEVFYLMLSSSDEIKNKGYKVDATVINYYLNDASSNLFKMYKSLDDVDDTLINQYAINFVIFENKKLGYNQEKTQINYLLKTGAIMLIISLFIMVIIICSTYLSGRIAASVAYDLRELVVRKVMSFSNSEFNSFSTSSLITRSTNDINQIQTFLTMLLRMVLFAPIIGCGALIKVINTNMVWVIGIAIFLIIILLFILLFFAMPKFKIVQKLIDRINLVVRETLNGLPVIRAFANENFEKKKFKKANDDLMKVNLFTQRLMALMSPCMMLIMNGICVLIMWVGADKINAGTMQVGTLTALITYTMHIIISFLMISMISIMGPRAIIAINRVEEVLKKCPSINEKKDAKKISLDDPFKLEFKNVSFKYPDGSDYVLEDLNFTVLEGETLAIIGLTGSGKSSIVNLIPRFFDVSEGEILINDINIKDLKLHDLRDIIGIVPQKGLLFSGTIASNIKFSNPKMSDEEMMDAASISCSRDFILEKNEGYNYLISEGGTNVSGGQRQRLSIARAIAKKPNIYIFDDSFSALDYKTDSVIRKNLEKHCKKATKIIVAQRVGTIMNADKIIVLDEGKIVGMGKHDDLYKSCSLYKDICLSQLKEEELV